ncbi:helicase SNF2 [Sorangium cellulosum]|uniref:Helicase SNF2 n=1 Tax=Sorangium cellulosum TaxID=56 RepID=A0A2L0EW62_SORCE|nr:DEAD/DEAH box helicase [Sorangium cellulosum]AUX43524.1 helicase SNF2 [Sorangium cellulosum]
MASDVQAAPPVLPEPPFATRSDLLAWLSQHGVAHLARLNLEAVAPRVDPALWPELHVLGARRRLIELASAEALSRSVEWLPPSRLRDVLPPLVARFLEDERDGAAEARAAAPALLQPPEEPRALPVHARLCALRARLPASVAPRPARSLRAGALHVDAALPGFRFEDPLPFEAHPPAAFGFIRPAARLVLAEGALRAECTCGASDCVHVLAAIDAALLWLRQPPTEAFFRALEELGRPAWERTLLALDRALEESPAARAGVELVFRLDVLGDAGVEVAPYVHRLGKKGQRGAGTRITRRRLLHEHGARLSPEDARAAALLPDGDGLASRALLEALVGHPRLVLGDAPDCPVRVERAPVGLVAEERSGAVRVSAGVEGTALPPALLERVRKAGPEDVVFLWDWDKGARRLTLLDVKAELRALLGVLVREGNLFPPESHGALLTALAKWAQRVPVAMPRSVMGESVPAEVLPVLRLVAHAHGAVEVELRVRALADGPALVPGRGARDVHLRRGDRALHAVRDLRREEDVARALAAELPLGGAEALEQQPFQFRFPSAHGALDLLAACARREPPPELEWVGKPVRALPSGGPQALKVVLERRRVWFGALGGLSVEGERVELARLLDAARRKERYVEVEAHTYVELDEALRRHLERLADHAHVSRHGVEVGPSAAEALRALEADGAALEADAAFRQLLDRVAAASALSPAVPAALTADLRPYQRDGFRWLARLARAGAGGVLADDMGLGKTVQALALLLDRSALGPALVVAPTSVAFNWRDEAQTFAPSLRLALYADAADRGEALAQLGPGDVLVLSYGLLVRDAELLAAQRFATVVFDEAQGLKNATTQRVRAARSLQADFKFALSGTPLENHLGELWSLFAVVFPGLLGSWESFRGRYAAPIERDADPAAAPALARVLAPFLLRRTKAQVEAELPARTEVRVPVVLSSAEWQLYEDARLAALSDLETRRSVLREQERRVEVLAALTRLRLLASHPRLYDARSELASSKLARLMELVDELRAEGQRALVFSQFTAHLALVRAALEARGIDYVYLDGKTPRKAREERVRTFQDGTAPLFLISLRAGGFGINLTAATNVIHLDPWWNPAVEDQASDRAHRLGQDRPVTIYRLVALGTIEEQMLSLHAQKRSLVAQVLSGKERAGKLSTEELANLLSERLRGPGGDDPESSHAPGPPAWQDSHPRFAAMELEVPR